jgi:methionine-rich copper-binding protein CopC
MKRFLAVALGLAFSFAAHAHTKLTESAPAADAAVPAPKAVYLTFAGDVRLTTVSLTDAAGVAKQLDAVPTATGSKFRIAIQEPLAPGAYKVVWRAVGGDTHIVSGEFGFTVVAAP